MRYVVVILALVFSVACGQKFQPEIAKLTPEEFQKLLYAPVESKKGSKPVERKFELFVTPTYVLWGQTVKVVCYVPRSYQNKGYQIQFGIEGLAMQVRRLQRMENSVVIANLECGTWNAICKVADDFRQQAITVGGSCDGSSDQ